MAETGDGVFETRQLRGASEPLYHGGRAVTNVPRDFNDFVPKHFRVALAAATQVLTLF